MYRVIYFQNRTFCDTLAPSAPVSDSIDERLKYVFTHNSISDLMPNMTLTVPKEMYREMKKHKELKWSDIARQAFKKRLEEIRWMDRVLSKSTLTEEDAEIIGHKIKHEIWKRFAKKVS